MNWLNIDIKNLRSPEYLGAEPIERATWLALLGWCADQENGGVIEGCSTWSDRKWQQLCGVTKSEVETISELYGYDGENLMVSFYPTEQEASTKAKRKAGKKGGRPKKRNPEKPTEPLKNKGEKPHGSSLIKANGNHKDELSKREAETESKVIVKKSKSKGRESLASGDAGSLADEIRFVGEDESPAPTRKPIDYPTLSEAKKHAKQISQLNPANAISERCVDLWHSEMESCGWVTKSGNPIVKWQAALSAFANRFNENERRFGNQPTSSTTSEVTQYKRQLS